MTVTSANAEQVHHPAHYGGADNQFETIKVLRAWLTPEAFEGFCLGNIVRYLSRAGKKGDDALTDFRKARWYLNCLIEAREGLCLTSL